MGLMWIYMCSNKKNDVANVFIHILRINDKDAEQNFNISFIVIHM